MPPKDLTKHQLSHRLQFQAHTPNFLKAFQAKVSGRYQDEDEDEPVIDNADEYGLGANDGDEGEELDEFGRSRRREIDEFGRQVQRERSVDAEKRRRLEEEEEDEKPVVVVLKEGKHLTEREAENERRKAKGLPPLPDESSSNEKAGKDGSKEGDLKPESTSTEKQAKPSKSAVQIGGKLGGASKRKAPIGGREEESGRDGPPKKKAKKKEKGAVKGLLSFGDDG